MFPALHDIAKANGESENEEITGNHRRDSVSMRDLFEGESATLGRVCKHKSEVVS